MKIIYILLISIVFGNNPIAAQQEAGTDDSLLTTDLVCNTRSKPGMQTTGIPAPSSSLGLSSKVETGINEPLVQDTNTEIQERTITQDSILQTSDPNYQPEPVDPETIDAFFLYPNPTAGMVQVKLSGKLLVLVYTISGQLIRKFTLAHGDRVLDLTDLAPGIYQVRAKSDEDYFSGKLLIQ